MTCNVGQADKAVRYTIGALALIASFTVVSGLLTYVLWAVAGIMVFTSAVSFCPLYRLVGINTCGFDGDRPKAVRE